eukprot:807442-Rhodomonas_salina.1
MMRSGCRATAADRLGQHRGRTAHAVRYPGLTWAFPRPGGTSLYSLELEDVVTIHLMESDGENDDSPKEVAPYTLHVPIAYLLTQLLSRPGNDNGDSAGLDTDGYKLNGAFRFSVDTANDRAYLDPTPELLAWCPFNPPRPSAGHMHRLPM